MDEKLKTLKDLTFEYQDGENEIIKDKLKAEATRHCKMLREVGEIRTLSWVKQFFNLTDEELENG